MDTATLTFHSPNNNGSFLQAYALQKVLIDEFKVNNKIINFYTQKQESQYAVFRKPRSVGDIVRNFISFFHYSALKKKFKTFERMRTEILLMTERCKSEEAAYKIMDGYDLIICGSDQIWNTQARDFFDLYLLPQCGKKKITYAVSCGSDISGIDANKIIPNAAGFDFISVRERALDGLFRQHGLSSKLVLDPTLLLQKSDYKHLYSEEPKIKGKYIFLYTISYDDEGLKIVKKLSKQMKLPVIAPFTGYSAVRCLKYGIKVLYNVAPDSFLNLIENAAVVCTNSFHGVAFSVIFGKNFFRLCKTDSKGEVVKDDRIDNILKSLELDSRNITLNDFKSSFAYTEIDYTAVYKKLEALKKISFEYLKAALES